MLPKPFKVTVPMFNFSYRGIVTMKTGFDLKPISIHLPIALPLAALLLALPSSRVMAQETGVIEQTAPAAKEGDKKKDAPEKISVVGSRIKRADVETSSPTVTISRDQIEASGVATVGELLRTQAVSSTGNFSGEAGYVRSGAQTGSLYGLGPGRTLVLVDGERLPKDASLSGTNLSVIPAAMVERLEILTGSRSAIYGSDAVAGVINIITRKDFTGTEVKTSVRVPENGGGESAELSAATGVDLGNGRGNVVISVGGSRETRMYETNRDISQGEGKFASLQFYQPADTYNYRLVDPVTFRPSPTSLWKPSPNCPTDQRSDQRGPGEPDRGTFCVGDIRSNNSSELTPSNQAGFISSKMHYELSSDSKLSSFLSFSRHLSRSNAGNYFSNNNYLTAGRRQVLSAEKAAQLGLQGTEGQAVEIYKVDTAAPDRITYNLDESYGGFLALDSELGAGWNSNVSVTHYTTKNSRDVDNVINKEQYQKLLQGYKEEADGKLTLTGNPAYTSVDPNRDTSLLSQMVDRMSADETNTLTSVSANANRELFALPGGNLALSVGVDGRVETFKQTPDPLDVLFWQNQPLFTGTESTSGEGDRQVASVYTEVLAPVADSVDLEVALRYDNYNDFGGAGNYNFGAKVDLTQTLALRANTGTSFRAPELNYIHQKGGGGYVNIRDDRWCDARNQQGIPCVAGETHQIFVDRPGNKDLSPETSTSYVIGAIYEPSRSFYISADYAGFKVKDVFNLRPVQDIVDDIYAGKEAGPATADFDPEFKYITAMKRPWQNIGQELIYLVQVESALTWKVGEVSMGYRTDATRTLSRQEEQTDGSLKQWNGYEGNPKWRWNNRITTSYQSTTLNLASSTIAKQAPDPENVDVYKATYFNDSVPEFTSYDASIDWAYSSRGKLGLGVINIFDRIGGKYRTGNFTGAENSNGMLYSASWYGRTVFANLTQSF
jgi:iron complex outermembrane receptor protein